MQGYRVARARTEYGSADSFPVVAHEVDNEPDARAVAKKFGIPIYDEVNLPDVAGRGALVASVQRTAMHHPKTYNHRRNGQPTLFEIRAPCATCYPRTFENAGHSSSS